MMDNINDNELGLVHVYTGNGKGKTSTAVGLSLRAIASGFKVCFFQFLKAESDISGEIREIIKAENIEVHRHGGNLLSKHHPPKELIIQQISNGLSQAFSLAKNKACNVLVLDEINTALNLGLADIESVKEIINICKKAKIELVLTGRGAPQEIIDLGDYVTEFKLIKHPYDKGIKARRGIEY